MQVPILITKIKYFSLPESILIPFYGGISAGFPSPAQDYIEDELDIKKLIIADPTSTYVWRVEGIGMVDAGIYPNDLLVVDRAKKPVNRSIVIAVVDGECVVRRLITNQGKKYLEETNSTALPTLLSSDADISIWGVVTYQIHKCAV